MQWGIPTAIPLIALVCYGALLFITARQDLKKAVNRFFAFYLLTMLVWSFGALMMYIDIRNALFWNTVMLSGLVGMPVAFFGFIQTFLPVRARVGWLYLGFITSTVFLVLNAQGHLTEYVYVTEEGLIRYQFGPAVPLFGICSAFFIGFAALNLVQGYRQTTDSIQRNRIRYALLGVGAIVLGTSTNLVPAFGAYPIDIAANVINALLLAYAIFRYQLLDITVVIRQGLLYSIPTAIIGAAYFLAISLSVNLFHFVTGYQVLLFSLAMAAVTAVAIQPLREKAQMVIDRLFFREKYDSSLMLQRLSGAAASVLDLDRLTDMILDEVLATMHIKRAAFFLLSQDESGQSHLMAQRGLDQNADLKLRKGHPIVGWLSSHEDVLTRHDVEARPLFKALWGEERKDLERMGAELFIPLKAKGELVGILAVGPKLSEETYSQDDQLTLTTLANQTAVAIENARLYWDLERTLKELRRAHDELETRVEERTAELARANEALQAEIAERKRAEEELRQRNEDLEALNYELSLLLEANKAASSSLDQQDILQTMAQKLTELARATCCRIALLDKTGENLVIRSAYPTGEALDWEPGVGQQYPVAVARWERKVIDTGEPVLWHRDDSSVLSDTEEVGPLGAGMKAVAFLPVILRGQVIGGVSLGERRGWERTPLDMAKIELCQALINEMVMAIENAWLYEETVQRAEQIARAERHLASVVESANDLVVSVNSEGRITTWNQTADRISGYTFEEAVGRQLGSLCEEGHQAAMEAMLEQAVLGERLEGTEITLLTRAGNRIPVAWNCSPMWDEEGHILGVVAVGRDLTERRRLEAQLIQSAKMASLGVMAGGIAHEIRNPLAVSSAAAQLLLEYPDDEQLRRECAEKVYSGISRAAVIVDNLLTFARRPEGREETVDINEALRQTLSLFAHQTTQQGIALHTEFSPDLHPTKGNKNLLQQVFSNMILNACNAMPDGGGLTIDTKLNADNEVEVRITDTGCGIPEENLGKIFDPFFTTMPVGQGTGLGLSICYSIVEQHRGEIDVHSEVGVGSTFVVRLPAVEVKK